MSQWESTLSPSSKSGRIPAQERLAGSHDSNRTSRLPGDLFRAMAVFYLLMKRDSSQGSLARKLCAQLDGMGVHYHIRTINRHLSGDVATVPVSIQDAMRDLLLRDTSLQTWRDVTFTLWSVGLSVTSDRLHPQYVSTQRIRPLVQLWLILNPNRSRRSLAVELSRRLANGGVKIKVNPLEVIFAGRQPSASREVLDELLLLLGEHGFGSEAEARVHWAQLAEDITAYSRDRKLQSAHWLMQLALVWKIYAHEPSSRRLADMLRSRLIERGLDLGLHRIQVALGGKAKTVRGALIAEMESLLGEILPKGKVLLRAVDEAANNLTQLTDLGWVHALPIAILAQRWLAESPETSIRQLAIRVAQTAQKMGYSTSHNTIQPILAGHKKKTRGFVYRAMLKQFQDHDEQVPAEHILPSRWLEASRPLIRIACLSAKKGENYAMQQSSKRRPVIGTKSGIITRNPAPHSSGQRCRRLAPLRMTK
ncbi:MAG: hypothetical protein V3R56_01155 [Xanthomonadales bacterium]